MYSNVGSKIKKIASFFTKLGIIISCLVALFVWNLMAQNYLLSGTGFVFALLIVVIGSLVSWLSSITLYAFGELVDNSSKMVKLLNEEEFSEE